MKAIFELFLSASLFGSVMILLVLAARFVLRKAPRGIFCLLWVLVGLRLLIPFQIKSELSLQPSFDPAAPAPTVAVQPQLPQEMVPAVPNVMPDNSVLPDVLPGDVVVNYDNDAVSAPVQRQIDFMEVAAWVWAVGAVAMAGYTAVTYVLLKRKLKDAVAVGEDVYESDAIDSPFLLGYVKPAVYLPKDISEEDRPYILAHERCHMDRYDNWFKLAGFLCVGLHWFNPLVWLGYHLLCRDIEMACDEAVVRHMDLSSRKGYSAALVSCSTERKFGACPVAFGEVSVKQRVLSVLNYRKPGFWITLACVAVIIFTAVCFMTIPADQPKEPTVETLPTEGEDSITQLCKEAFEACVGDDIYHIQVDTKYESKSGMMNYSTETDYWRYGDNWYQSYTVFERDFTYSGQDVSYEGKRLQNKYDGQWTVSNDIAEPTGPVAMELDFDRLTYLDTDAASGSRGYRFMLDGDEENTITFCFDGGGKLSYLLHSFDLVTEMDTVSHVTVNCRLQSTSGRNILQNIEWIYRSAHGVEVEPTDLVEQCKSAVAAIQNADSYSFVVQYQTDDPDILLRRDTMKYWYSDGNYLACHAATDWENWYLDYNGKYYRKTITDSMPPEEVNDGNWISVVESGRNFLGLPWFMYENWGASDLVLLSSKDVSGQRVISFAVDESESGEDHTITFRFDLGSGSLIAIERTLTYESNGNICTAYSVVSDIRLNQTDIGQMIGQQYLETQLQVIE